MQGAYTFRPLKEGDEAAEAAARAFARASIYERVWLHAALELPILRARAEPLAAFHGARVVGLAAAIAGVFPFRAVAIDAALPGIARALFARLESPFVCRVPLRLTSELTRAGARPIRAERQMVRLDPCAASALIDPQIERLSDAGELARFCGPRFTPLALELGPFFGVRDAFGDLTAVAGTHLLSERIALIGHLETREDCRRQGAARALAAALACGLETPERRVVVHLNHGDRPAEHLFAELGFRGVHDFSVFAR
ncbi:MAG TPA: GNAT family N-acetyltransferase [Myxococcota bacterium]|nr:GNAT family N-acetyltransferase [Myxococcota bacterium]